ncbi:MAG: YcgN family cysteine cluster protein [Sphingomonadales bacterium]
MTAAEFWKHKTLRQMSVEEWESLCDGCGLCCLHKLEDIDSGEIAFTNVACRLLDDATCRCKRYDSRQGLVPDCLVLTPKSVDDLGWLPATCSYRLIGEGKGLPSWHPLVCGDTERVHTAGISVRGRVISETVAGDLEDYIVHWPVLLSA